MATYSFRDSWWVPGRVGRVRDILHDLEHYPSWWPQVRAVASLGPEDALVVCRSTLPYRLELRLHAVHREAGRLETSVHGDLEGEVRWLLRAEGGGTRVDFEQDVEVANPRLSRLSPALRPLMVWNHEQMMAGCIAGLRRRLLGTAVPARIG